MPAHTTLGPENLSKRKGAALWLPSYVCARGFVSNMLQVFSRVRSGMLQLTNLADPRRRRLCAVFVLLAVCSLTAFVATRYCFTRSSSSSTAEVRKLASLNSSRQRMTKTAPEWIPPVDRSVILRAPTAYPRIAPAAPPQGRSIFEESLYYRPPPSC